MTLYDGDGNIACTVLRPMCEEPPVVLATLWCVTCAQGHDPCHLCAEHYRLFADGIPCTNCGTIISISEPVAL